MLYDCRTVGERDWGIRAAVDGIARGDLVVLPTDTVYGIAADAFKPWAVSALLNAKGRGRHMPPPVLVGNRSTLDGLVFSLPAAARALTEAFWPGALTIVVEQAPTLQWDLGDTYGTVAVRMPLHPVALEVLKQTGLSGISDDSVSYRIRTLVPWTREEASYLWGFTTEPPESIAELELLIPHIEALKALSPM